MIQGHLREIMKEKNMTILGLVAASGVAKKTVDRARGPLIRECRLSTLEAIAGALGVKVKDLFEEVDDGKRKD